jgi:uncharacterized BrkB/YihY/UPF0761 family membrane protein
LVFLIAILLDVKYQQDFLFCRFIQAIMKLLQVDTTDAGYKMGYYIGSWLPFGLLLIVTIVVVYFVLKNRRKHGR